MSENEEKSVVPGSIPEVEEAARIKESHYVVQIELINPAQYGPSKRSYLRVNAAQKPEIKNGELHIFGYGISDYSVPVGNIAYRKSAYIWVAHFDRDDCTYNAYNYPIAGDDPIGEYVDKDGRIWGTLYEDGHIERYGT